MLIQSCKSINSPAKINLYLSIGDKRPDGYHEIQTIMQQIDLCDTITIYLTNDSLDNNISIKCNHPDVPTDEKNLCYKAVSLFFKTADINIPKITVEINKNIPMQAGLAGGSSNAASCLKLLNSMHNNIFSKEKLKLIASKIGADVPFFLEDSTCIATGFGEVLEPIKSIPECYLVIIKPDFHSSTVEAYQKYDSLNINNKPSIENIIKSIDKSDLLNISQDLYNDFEVVLNHPEIFNIKKLLIQNGAMGSLMSGSGTSVYGIFNSHDSAKLALDNLSSTYSNIFLCKNII